MKCSETLTPRWLLPLFISAAFLFPSNASAENWDALLSDLLGYLNMDSARFRQRLHAGEIVYAGMRDHEALPEQLTVGGTLMLLEQRPAAHVVRAFIDVEKMVKHASSDVLGLFMPDDLSVFYKLDLPPEELQKYGSTRAPATFNLSAREADWLRKQTPVTDEAYRDLLKGRFQRYYEQGLSGLELYTRPNRSDDPAQELLTAVEDLVFLETHFPDFHSRVLSKPADQPGSSEQLFVLHETESSGNTIHVLSRQLFETNNAWGLGVDIQFYATHGLNAGLVLMGVVPYQGGSLVFAVFHLFTDEVRGMGTALKKRVGRSRATEILKTHFHDVRLRLQDEAKTATTVPSQ